MSWKTVLSDGVVPPQSVPVGIPASLGTLQGMPLLAFHTTHYKSLMHHIKQSEKCVASTKMEKSHVKHENIQLFEFKINICNIENVSLIHLFAFYITAFNKTFC